MACFEKLKTVNLRYRVLFFTQGVCNSIGKCNFRNKMDNKAAQILSQMSYRCPRTFGEGIIAQHLLLLNYGMTTKTVSENRADSNQQDAMACAGGNKKVENWLAGL